MAYSDSRWDEVTAGRVYPKPVDAREAAIAEVRATLCARAHFERNRRAAEALTHEPLVKPAAYKNLSSANGSGPSAVPERPAHNLQGDLLVVFERLAAQARS